MISVPQIKLTIYNSFYNVIRVGTQPTVADFYKLTLKQSMPPNPQVPSDYPDFWWDAIALQIQNGFMAHKAFLNALDGAWLKQHNDNGDTWQTVLDYTTNYIEDLIPIP